MAKSAKSAVSEKDVLASIQSRNYAPIYAFDGEEPYYIDKLTDYAESHILQPAEKDFNLTIFYGKDANWADVVSACRRFPMFAERQVVILKEAQTMKDLAKLEVYLEQPTPTTIFIIAHKYKKFDGRINFTKLIQKKGIYFTSEPVKEYNITKWIGSYLSEKNIKADAKVLETLAVYLGTDLQKIINEIDKVLINTPDAKELTAQLVEKYIGISREYNVFELPNAIFAADVEKTFRMVNYFTANPKDAPMPLVLGTLFNNFQKLYAYHFCANKSQAEIASALKISPFFVKDYAGYGRRFNLQKTEGALHMLAEYNLRAIGIKNTVSQEGLLQELVTKLFYL
jgi:DNA polymerase III subunit delta